MYEEEWPESSQVLIPAKTELKKLSEFQKKICAIGSLCPLLPLFIPLDSLQTDEPLLSCKILAPLFLEDCGRLESSVEIKSGNSARPHTHRTRLSFASTLPACSPGTNPTLPAKIATFLTESSKSLFPIILPVCRLSTLITHQNPSARSWTIQDEKWLKLSPNF